MYNIQLMKTTTFFLVSLLMILGSDNFAQGIDFFHGTYKEALEKSIKEDKLIFIDAYTIWCGPCKAMAKYEFTQKVVGDFFNKNFINVKLNMEANESINFKKKFSVNAYPTLFFIDGEQKLVHKSVGGKKANALVDMGKMAIRKNDKSGNFAEAYEKGDRSYDLVLDYVKALNNAGKPSLKIANDYLKSDPNITKEQRSAFIYEALIEADSRLFDEYVESKNEIIQLNGEDAYYDKMQISAWKTVDKAIEYEVESLVDEAIEKIKEHHRDHKLFSYEANLKYCRSLKMPDRFVETANKYFKKYAKNDPDLLKKLIGQCQISFNNKYKVMSEAESYAKRLAKIESLPANHVLYAKLLIKNKKKDKALYAAQKALKIAKEDGTDTKRIEGLIRYIEST